MYYEKVGLAYGSASGREIQPDYPSTAIDIQPKIDEFRIVGSTGASAGITVSKQVMELFLQIILPLQRQKLLMV